MGKSPKSVQSSASAIKIAKSIANNTSKTSTACTKAKAIPEAKAGEKLPKWASLNKVGFIGKFLITPNASHSELIGFNDDTTEDDDNDEEEDAFSSSSSSSVSQRIKVRIAARPVDGEANAEFLKLLKKITKLPVSKLVLVRGDTSRSKDILFHTEDVEGVIQLILKEIS